MKQIQKIIFSLNFFLVTAIAIHAQVKVACVGNSITYGYGLSSPSTQSYPARLQVLLGNGYSISNFGVSARTMLKNGDRPYWNEPAYTQALALNPDIVIIMLGTNDSKLNTNWTPHKDDFYGDYVDMIKSFKSLDSKPEIYACLVPPAYKEIWEISDATIKNEVNPKIKQVAIDECVNLVDMYTHMSDKNATFLSDGIHPNATGASEIANYIYEILTTEKTNITEFSNTLTAPESASYQWYLFDTPIEEINEGKNQTLSNPDSGTYKVGLQSDENRSTVLISNETTFENTLSVNSFEKKSDNEFKIHPIPFKNYFYLSSKNTDSKKIFIYTLNGALVHRSKNWIKNSTEKIEIKNIGSGLYIYKIITPTNSNLHSGKLIIDKSY